MGQMTVSVVTVCLNAARDIERSMRSVLEQTHPDIDYVVVDGGSTDGTTGIVEKHRPRIASFISEADRGLYHAMNKGVARARGDVVFFLNADDYLIDSQVLSDITAAFADGSAPDIVYGDLCWDIRGERVPCRQPDMVTRRFLAARTILHQSLFVKRNLFDLIGPFAEDLKVVGDYEWLLRASRTPALRWRHLRRDVSVMNTGGVSWQSNWEAERLRVMRRYFRPDEILFYRTIPQYFRNLRRRVRAWTGRTP